MTIPETRLWITPDPHAMILILCEAAAGGRPARRAPAADTSIPGVHPRAIGSTTRSCDKDKAQTPYLWCWPPKRTPVLRSQGSGASGVPVEDPLRVAVGALAPRQHAPVLGGARGHPGAILGLVLVLHEVADLVPHLLEQPLEHAGRVVGIAHPAQQLSPLSRVSPIKWWDSTVNGLHQNRRMVPPVRYRLSPQCIDNVADVKRRIRKFNIVAWPKRVPIPQRGSLLHRPINPASQVFHDRLRDLPRKD